MRSWLAFCLACAGAVALEVRNTPADYPVQGSTPDMKVGAEYTVRTFLAEQQSFSIDDYLLVEIGIFPTRDTTVNLSHFNLRVNGKTTLAAQTPGMVAGSVKYPDWTRRPSVEAGVGSSTGGGIILGRPQRVERFPGDERPGTPLPKSPDSLPEKPQIDYDQLIKASALPEGQVNRPVAGYVFFPFDGKLKSIRTVELLVHGVALKLR